MQDRQRLFTARDASFIPLVPHRRFLCVFACSLAAQGVLAADFTVISGTTDTTAKTITNGDNGTVQTGASLTTSGATQAVTGNGTTGIATLNNAGAISQTGTARAIRMMCETRTRSRRRSFPAAW
jgi:hypothetical protein